MYPAAIILIRNCHGMNLYWLTSRTGELKRLCMYVMVLWGFFHFVIHFIIIIIMANVY